MVNGIQILVIIIGAILIAYIVYLHYQLQQKNSMIKSFVENLLKDNKKLDKNEVLKLLKDYKIPEYSTLFERDVVLKDDVMNFIFHHNEECHVFLHYTKEEDVAKKILKEGFKFVYSFYKTAELVFEDKLDIIYKHYRHRQFGPYVIIICITKELYSEYAKKLNQAGVANPVVEQVITEVRPTLNENSEQVFVLPSQFIKGYFDYFSGEMESNPSFQPDYHPTIFAVNLKTLSKTN